MYPLRKSSHPVKELNMYKTILHPSLTQLSPTKKKEEETKPNTSKTDIELIPLHGRKPDPDRPRNHYQDEISTY